MAKTRERIQEEASKKLNASIDKHKAKKDIFNHSFDMPKQETKKDKRAKK